MSADHPATLEAFTKQNKISYPLLGDFRRAMLPGYDALVTDEKSPIFRYAKRAYYVIDRNGVVRYMKSTRIPRSGSADVLRRSRTRECEPRPLAASILSRRCSGPGSRRRSPPPRRRPGRTGRPSLRITQTRAPQPAASSTGASAARGSEGKALLLFWATWPTCREGSYRRQSVVRGGPGLEVLLISFARARTREATVTERGYTAPVLLGASGDVTSRGYGVFGPPGYLVDREGGWSAGWRRRRLGRPAAGTHPHFVAPKR